MKKLLLSLALVATLAVTAPVAFTGCQSPPQRVAYNTIASVEQTASAALDGYYKAVLNGQAKTNDVPKVSQMFNQLQAGCTLAATTAQNGTNAIAPANLTIELTELTTFIGQLIVK